MNPTDEQTFALDLFSTQEDLVVEAGAGTGKTSTLVLMAEDAEGDRYGQYVAFNKAIVTEAERKFGRNMKCNTAHSLAFRRVGYRFKKRMDETRRMKSHELAAIMGVTSFRVGDKTLAAGFLAGAVMKAITNFCNSADEELSTRHFSYIDGIDEPFADGKRSYANNNMLQQYLLPFAQVAWADIQVVNGRLPFKHEHYLKIWQLNDPVIEADFVLFDEAQDANPVMQAIVAAQDHAQKVYVGDSQQQIYEFTGAVNAMANIEAERAYLTQSWRFGQDIADKANEILAILDAPLRLTGHPGIASTVETVEDPRAFLSRTNAGAIRRVFTEMAKGGQPHLVGGGTDITNFAYGAMKLMKGERTDHVELACFDDWAEVCDYVANDQQGDELRLMVTIMNEFGPVSVIEALRAMPKEDKASLIISTAHKSKGREWDTVVLADDFPKPEKMNEGEHRLLYVAVTRAKQTLDPFSVPSFTPVQGLLPDDVDAADDEAEVA